MFRKTNSQRPQLHQHSIPGRRHSRSKDRLSVIVLFGLVLLSISLLVLSKTENQQLTGWQEKGLELAAPVLELTSIPAGYIQRSLDRVASFYDINHKLNELQIENKKLRVLKWDNERLERNNTKLRALLNSVKEPRVKFISGQIISGNTDLFGQPVLLNIGRRNGVRNGFAVINTRGFLGRTASTGKRTSRILLLTDRSSHIPVSIGKKEVRGVAIGTGTRLPKIEFLPPNAGIYDGDMVFTSGQGGDLPRGLRIGTIKKFGNDYHIALTTRHEGTQYVSVLYFEQSELAQQP